MTESDLRRHLAAQTSLHIGALQLTSYADLPDSYTRSQHDAVVLDALTDTDLRLVGQTLIASSNNHPLFTIGSGGLSRALALNLATASPIPPNEPHQPSHTATTTPPVPAAPVPPTPKPTPHASSSPLSAAPEPATPGPAPVPAAPTSSSPLSSSSLSSAPLCPAPLSPGRSPGRPQVLVVSGSRSTRTRQQIEYAVSSGWLSSDVRDPTVAQRAVAALRNGAPGVVVHTGETSQDPVGSLGEALAAVASEVVQRTDVRRLVIAGGDTSGRVVRKLGVTALELLPTPDHLGPGTALCRATSPDPTIDGLHFLLKGGQIGPPTLFETFRTT